MSFWTQIVLGSLVLATGAAVHIAVLVGAIWGLEAVGETAQTWAPLSRWAVLLPVGFVAVLIGHSLQIWIWALAFRATGALSHLSAAVYFALVTTTTLGYGDITLSREHRLFGSMAAVAGLLTFGLSTAFLIGVMEGALAGTG